MHVHSEDPMSSICLYNMTSGSLCVVDIHSTVTKAEST